MNLLRFELKKFVKQKKYLWLFLVLVFITGALFSVNTYQRSRLQGNWAKYNALPEVARLEGGWVSAETSLVRKRDQGTLTEAEEQQLKYTNEMALVIQRLRICRNMGRWADAPRYKLEFLQILDNFLEAGGEFPALEGMEKEIEFEINTWLLEHGLPYELERYPITPHLFLQQSSIFLLSILGLVIVLIFFGNSITEEKENSTWLTIKTQPISKAKLILSKYLVFLMVTCIFILMVVGIGLLLPLLTQGNNLNLSYPQVITQGDTFTIISTGEYLLRNIILFICASSIVFSIALVISKWVTRSVSLYFMTGIGVALGYLATSFLRTPLNPFYLLNSSEILNSMPSSNDWIYVFTSLLWTGIFIGLTIYLMKLPEKQIRAEILQGNKPYSRGNTSTKGNLLLNLFTFEWRKVKRHGSFKTLVIVTMIVAIAGQFFLSSLADQRKEEYYAELDWRISAIREQIIETEQGFEELQRMVEEGYEFEDWMVYEGYEEYWEEVVDYLYSQIEMIEDVKLAYDEGDWVTFHKYQKWVIERSKTQSTFISNDNYNEEVSLEEKKWLIERNIQPIFAGEYIPTIHQNWRGYNVWDGGRQLVGWRGEELPKDQWESQNRRYDSSGLFTLYHGITSYIYFLPIALLLFLFGGALAKEKGKRPTLNFLKTQPITERHIYLSMALKIITVTLIGVLTIGLIIVLTGTVLNRLGDWEYPILHYNSWKTTNSPDYEGLKAGFGYGYHFITLGEYIMKGTLLVTAITLLFMAVSTALSLILKRTLSVFASTLLILAGGYYLNMKKYLQMTHRSPFTYFDVPKILNGEIATSLNEPRVNAMTGIFVLLTVSILIILAGYLFSNRKKLFTVVTKSWKKRISNNA